MAAREMRQGWVRGLQSFSTVTSSVGSTSPAWTVVGEGGSERPSIVAETGDGTRDQIGDEGAAQNRMELTRILNKFQLNSLREKLFARMTRV